MRKSRNACVKLASIRNFAKEMDRLQNERIAAFKEFHADVQTSAFPSESQVTQANPGEFEKFLKLLEKSKHA